MFPSCPKAFSGSSFPTEYKLIALYSKILLILSPLIFQPYLPSLLHAFYNRLSIVVFSIFTSTSWHIFEALYQKVTLIFPNSTQILSLQKCKDLFLYLHISTLISSSPPLSKHKQISYNFFINSTSLQFCACIIVTICAYIFVPNCD